MKGFVIDVLWSMGHWFPLLMTLAAWMSNYPDTDYRYAYVLTALLAFAVRRESRRKGYL